MRKILHMILAVVAMGLVSACAMETDPPGKNDPDEMGSQDSEAGKIGSTRQAISYGGNDCTLVYYDEFWVDPNNPPEAHVVAWFECDDYFATPIGTYSTIKLFGANYEWMVWGPYGSNPYTYMVFLNGYTFYYYKVILGLTPAQIFANLQFY